MDRIPSDVFIVLGRTRSECKALGMVGCGLQLNDIGDYAWSETTFSVSLDAPEVRVYLRVKGIPYITIPTLSSIARVNFQQMEEYIGVLPDIRKFLREYSRNRFLRLGNKASREPDSLDSRDAFLLRMSNEEFEKFYVSDPRGSLSVSSLLRGYTLHPPVLKGVEPAGLPAPGLGDWI
jgi:hypothetical protein